MDEISVKPKRTPRKSIIKPKEVEKKNPIGRPTTYKPEYCQQVIDFMAQGYSLEAFAGSIGHHKQTVYEWRDKYPDFGDSIKLAFESCRLKWEKMGIDGVYLTGQNEKFNAALWIFNMKNRFRNEWRDQQHTEVTGSVNQNIQIAHTLQPLSIEELYLQYEQKKLASAPKLLED